MPANVVDASAVTPEFTPDELIRLQDWYSRESRSKIALYQLLRRSHGAPINKAALARQRGSSRPSVYADFHWLEARHFIRDASEDRGTCEILPFPVYQASSGACLNRGGMLVLHAGDETPLEGDEDYTDVYARLIGVPEGGLFSVRSLATEYGVSRTCVGKSLHELQARRLIYVARKFILTLPQVPPADADPTEHCQSVVDAAGARYKQLRVSKQVGFDRLVNVFRTVNNAQGHEVASVLSEKERAAARRLANNYSMPHILPRMIVFLCIPGQSDELPKIIEKYGSTLLTFEKNLGLVECIWDEMRAAHQSNRFWTYYLRGLKLPKDLCD